MADNLLNVAIPQNSWVDLYALTGLAVGTQLIVENSGDIDVYLAVQATAPDQDHDSYNVVKRPPSISVQNTEGDPGAWAFCQGGTGKLSISTPAREGFVPLNRVALHDGFGSPIASLNNSIDVHDADIHTDLVNGYFHRLGVSTTLAVAANSGDIQIAVVDASGFAVGDAVHLGPTPQTTEPIHPFITDIDIPNDIFTLDRPIDSNYIVDSNVSQALINMVQGTGGAVLSSPVINRYNPGIGQVEHVHRILVSMQHSLAADDSKFGSISALTNGVVLRISVDGQIRTFTNWKDNGDLILDMYDVRYTDKAGPGLFGTSARGSFIRVGVSIRLDPNTNDFMELRVQDDLTGLVSVAVRAQGHVEREEI